MAKLYNLARMTTATTGTGTITLGSAVPSYVSFANSGVSNGETVTYAIVDGNNREVGRGVYTSSGTTLTRTVLESTNSNNPINLSGNAEVFITAAAEDIANVGETNTFTASQIINVTDNSNAALRVTQNGTGLAIRVEDSANPDASPFVVTADGNVGIGVASPTARLELYTNAASTVSMNTGNSQGTWTYGVDSAGNASIYSNSAKNILMSTSGTERLRISDAGVATITGTGIINSTSSNDALRINQLGSGAAIRVEDSANPDSSPFIVTAEGKVGIGEDVPLFYLQVAAPNASTQTNVGITSTNYTSDFKATYLQFSDSSTTGTTYGITNANLGALLFQNTSNALIGTNGGTPLIFGTLSLERFRIGSAGQWGIGGANYGTAGQFIKSAGSAAAPSWSSLTISDVTNLQTSLDNKLDDSQATAFGLSLLDDVDAAAGRTTLGLGTIATQDANNVSISGGSISGITDLAVADGGTGVSSFTAYSLVAGGTTSTGSLQSVSGVGTSGQVLTSNGAGALPTWQNASAGSSPWVQITAPTSVTAVTNLDITWDETLYSEIKIVLEGVIPASDGSALRYRVGHTDGATIITSNSYLTTEMGSATLGIAGYGLLANSVGTAAGEVLNLIIDIQSNTTTTGNLAVSRASYDNTINEARQNFSVTEVQANNIIDTARFYWSSGNFEAAGTYAVYGLKRTV